MHERINPEQGSQGKRFFGREERMGSGCKVGGACEECANKCMLIHGRKDPSPIVVSFFKIMIDDRFSSSLFVPPKFAPKMVSLVDQQTYLENSSGQLWRVKISIVDGQLAFQQGWLKFASDHSLEIGDLVLFNYIIGSHFVVQVYGRNGCEKLSFSEKSNRQREKRTKAKVSLDHLPLDGRNLIAKKVPSHTIDKGSMNEQGSSSTVNFDSDVEIIQDEGAVKDAKQVPKSTEKAFHCDDSNTRSEPLLSKHHTEVPFYMIDRDTVDNQGANRNFLFDLSNFEMLKSTSGANGMDNVAVAIEKEKSPVSEVNLVQPQTTLETECVEGGCNIIDKGPSWKGESRGAPLDVSDLEMTKRKCNSEGTNKVQLAKDKIPLRSTTSQQPQNASAVDCGKNEMVNPDGSNGTFRKGNTPMVVKVEREEMVYPSEKAEGNYWEEMETENLNSNGIPLLNSATLCCSVSAVTQTHLELPTDSPSFSHTGNMKLERKIVFVRDPAMRVWPVMYHERTGFRVLGNGWEALAKANNIQQGDTCVFGVEDENEGLIHVRICRG